MKTAISIPDELFEKADRVARRLGLSRSQLYQQALARFIAGHDETSIIAELNRVYASQEESQLDPVLGSLQRSSLVREDW